MLLAKVDQHEPRRICARGHCAAAQAERAALGGGSAASALLQDAAAARRAAHQAHRRQLETLERAVATLEEGMAGSNSTVG